MEVIGISEELDEKRKRFFHTLFGNSEGYFCLAYGSPDKGLFREEYFDYPDKFGDVLDRVNELVGDYNIWFCTSLLKVKRRQKIDVEFSNVAWADLDSCLPSSMKVEPTLTVETSPGSYQALWCFDRPVDPEDAEDVSRRIVYYHADEGADKGGWGTGKLLRVPYTYNFKYRDQPTVQIIDANRGRYRVSDFAAYPTPSEYKYLDTPVPKPEELQGDPEELLRRKRLRLNSQVFDLYEKESKPIDGKSHRSEDLWKLLMFLFESEYTKEEVFLIGKHAKCNKWGDRDDRLWDDVLRAWNQHERNVNLLVGAVSTTGVNLVSDAERTGALAEDSFVERYITWAKSLGDAAPQYHQAGAFIALSSLLAGRVKLPTSFGTVLPNLWFMILGDTTLTRKSTAMDIAMDLIMEIDPDTVMATDGSIEGLLTSLATRPGRPSVFLRDEFSGLLEMIQKRDYYAGMAELLTKMYDGKFQKRVLRKETIEVRDPILIIFAGGIKDKVTGLLSYEHVSSGFMPRFIFVTAISDVTKIKPLGPPTDFTDDNRDVIRGELADMVRFYTRKTTVTFEETMKTIEVEKKWSAKLTDEAWLRYNALEAQMLTAGMESQRPDIMTPTYSRLAVSILKAATLLAAARMDSEDVVVIEKKDIIRAAVYGQQWRDFGLEVMNNVGLGAAERQLEQILRLIERKPGCTRSHIMQYYHINARDMEGMLMTLQQRSQITRQRAGKTEQLYPLLPVGRNL